MIEGKAVRVIHPAYIRGQVVGRALCRRNGSAVLFLVIACFLQIVLLMDSSGETYSLCVIGVKILLHNRQIVRQSVGFQFVEVLIPLSIGSTFMIQFAFWVFM